jgi:6-phosphofructokinase
MSQRPGILTGGKDAPGLDAVIRAVFQHGVGELHCQLIGIELGG